MASCKWISEFIFREKKAVDLSRGVSNIVNPKVAEYTAASTGAVGLKNDELDDYKKFIQNEWLMNSLYDNLTEDGNFNKAGEIFTKLQIVDDSLINKILDGIRQEIWNDEGFRYLYMDDQGMTRQCNFEERKYLCMLFSGGDGGRPYIKSSWNQKSPNGSLAGFIIARQLYNR